MWRKKFLEKNGFEHLIRILRTFKYDNNHFQDSLKQHQHQSPVLQNTQQLALTSILKMVYSFFIGAILCLPEMTEVVNQIQSLTLPFYETEDKEKEKEKEKKKKKEKKRKKNKTK